MSLYSAPATCDAIDMMLEVLYMGKHLDPSCLFVNQESCAQLSEEVFHRTSHDPYPYRFTKYVNKTTGKLIRVIIVHGTPSNTAAFGEEHQFSEVVHV